MADEANEQEISDDQSLEEVGKILAGREAATEVDEPSAEAEETAEEETDEEVSVEEQLGLSDEDKRTLGRVQGLQSKTDSTASKVEGLEAQIKTTNEQIKTLVETFQKGLNKPLDAEGLTQGLTGDNGVEFFTKQAQEANADLRLQMEQLAEQQKELLAAQKSQQAQNDYQNELVAIAGDDYSKFEPVYNEIMEVVADKAAAGNQEALRMQERMRNNPEYLHMKAMEMGSKKVRAKAAEHEASVTEAADMAKDASSPGPVIAPPTEMSDPDSINGALKILLGQ